MRIDDAVIKITRRNSDRRNLNMAVLLEDNLQSNWSQAKRHNDNVAMQLQPSVISPLGMRAC